MSHFTNLETGLRNPFHLENALKELDITYKKENEGLEPSNINLIIPQSNNSDITFNWNGEIGVGGEYELIFHTGFWSQPDPAETFINKVSETYAKIAMSEKITKLVGVIKKEIEEITKLTLFETSRLVPAIEETFETDVQELKYLADRFEELKYKSDKELKAWDDEFGDQEHKPYWLKFFNIN